MTRPILTSASTATVPPSGDLQWAIGPARPALAAGAAHVWLADLTAVSAALTRVLSEQEQLRAGQLLSARRRAGWMRSQALLRVLLGRYLDAAPTSIELAHGRYGKPELAEDHCGSLYFNLAHSGGHALYAFTDLGAVGVDIEPERPKLNELSLSRRLLAGAESRRLAAMEPPQRAHELLRLWTRHEATLKLSGRGLAGAGRKYAEHVWLADLQPGAGLTGALALDGPPSELRCWTWAGAQPSP